MSVLGFLPGGNENSKFSESLTAMTRRREETPGENLSRSGHSGAADAASLRIFLRALREILSLPLCSLCLCGKDSLLRNENREFSESLTAMTRWREETLGESCWRDFFSQRTQRCSGRSVFVCFA